SDTGVSSVRVGSRVQRRRAAGGPRAGRAEAVEGCGWRAAGGRRRWGGASGVFSSFLRGAIYRKSPRNRVVVSLYDGAWRDACQALVVADGPPVSSPRWGILRSRPRQRLRTLVHEVVQSKPFRTR